MQGTSARTMQIHIWTPAGELFTFSDLDSFDSVAKFQGRLAALSGIAAERQKLTFRGRHLESSRVLVEYGIHEHHQGIITVEFEDSGVPCVFESNDSGVSDSSENGNLLLHSPRLVDLHSPRLMDSLQMASNSHFQEFGSKTVAASETSTCVPSECTSECGDVESCGASVLIPSVSSFTRGYSGDAFVDANSAHVTYLLLRHKRLEAAGLGVSTLCR